MGHTRLQPRGKPHNFQDNKEEFVAFFALADLHLGHAVDKPMDPFGEHWRDHTQKIAENWRAVVEPDDIVLVPGDISWAMTKEQAVPDLAFLAQLPGRKILLRGNHDYWWSGIGRVRSMLPTDIFALQNDHLVIDGWAICGTRGWTLPDGSADADENDKKLYLREKQRLEMSLRSAPKELPKIVMMHFPPRYKGGLNNYGFCGVLEKHQVSLCVYGHLHGADHHLALIGTVKGVNYVFCAADAVDFTPVRLPI